MNLWIDDIRSAPTGYLWVTDVDGAISTIIMLERHYGKNYIEIIDIDHDAGDYAKFGGDYIKLLDWLEETGRNYPIHIHSMNPVGAENMRAIIRRNGWTELWAIGKHMNVTVG